MRHRWPLAAQSKEASATARQPDNTAPGRRSGGQALPVELILLVDCHAVEVCARSQLAIEPEACWLTARDTPGIEGRMIGLGAGRWLASPAITVAALRLVADPECQAAGGGLDMD